MLSIFAQHMLWRFQFILFSIINAMPPRSLPYISSSLHIWEAADHSRCWLLSGSAAGCPCRVIQLGNKIIEEPDSSAPSVSETEVFEVTN